MPEQRASHESITNFCYNRDFVSLPTPPNLKLVTPTKQLISKL